MFQIQMYTDWLLSYDQTSDKSSRQLANFVTDPFAKSATRYEPKLEIINKNFLGNYARTMITMRHEA